MKPSLVTEFYRAYKHKVDGANRDKLDRVFWIYSEYRRVAGILLRGHLRYFFENGTLHRSNLIYKPVETFLSERYKDVIDRQVRGMLQSYVSNRKNDFRKRVAKSSLSKEEKIMLYKINRTNGWFAKENHLARKIFKHIMKENHLPRTTNINMQLNNKVVDVQVGETGTFGRWLRVSTEVRGDFLYLPLTRNSRFEDADGEISGSCEIIIRQEKVVGVVLYRVVTPDHSKYVPRTEKIGIDLGLCVLMATGRGDLIGQGFMKKLLYYDHKTVNLVKDLRRNGIKKLRESRRYCDLIQDTREYVKNEISRCLNVIMKLYSPREVVLENLDFRYSHLSRRMNRLMRNFGLSVIKQKMRSLEEEFGIIVTYENPAFTSQECSSCGFVDERNRKDRDHFECQFCGLRIHADVNGARIVEGRSLLGIKEFATRADILRSLTRRWSGRWIGEGDLSFTRSEVYRSNKYYNVYPTNMSGFSTS